MELFGKTERLLFCCRPVTEVATKCVEVYMQTVKLTPEQITAIERTLTAGDRVELVPVKDGAKVFQMRRKEIQGDTAERR